MVAGLNAAGILRCVVQVALPCLLQRVELVDGVLFAGWFCLHRDGVFVCLESLGRVGTAFLPFHDRVFPSHEVRPEPEGGHDVHVFQREAHHVPQHIRHVAPLGEFFLEFFVFRSGGQLAVEQKVAHLLEGGVGGQIKDVVALIDEPAF